MGGGMISATTLVPQPSNLQKELEVLKTRSEMLAEQLSELREHIEELGRG